ncbi:hypothetical protein [Kribbella deserti]|uniref:Uncharacterized protein n=1 Tax=Kribbella deserti TaxID=1926257 RepID=A0ABV6QX74_9ACTN
MAALIRERASAAGVVVRVEVHSRELAGASGVGVDWDGGDLLFEVVDWVDGVRILDPNGEDVSIADALQYFELRAFGHTPTQAWAGISPPPWRLRQRLRGVRAYVSEPS